MEDNQRDMACEPALAYSNYSYSDVMAYLHSIHLSREDKARVAKRLTVEVSEPALADAYETVDRLALLEPDWDGEGALPISTSVLRNIRQVLMISDNSDWKNWAISPDGNATLGLQSKNGPALMSLGRHEFSYYVEKDGVGSGKNHQLFSPEDFLAVMRKIG